MLRLTTFGTLDLRADDGTPIRDLLVQPKRIALLVYLVVEGARGPVARDRILAMFWPESDEARARNALSQSLYHLRQSLGADVIASQGTTMLEVNGALLGCDACEFLEAAARGDADAALDLYKGEFCPTLVVSAAPGFDEWLDARRRELRQLALAVARKQGDRLATAADHAGAARIARRALALQPDNERDVTAYLAMLESDGDVTGALLAYDQHARRLALDLETQPAPETRRLVEAIRARRAQAASAARPTSTSQPSDHGRSASAAFSLPSSSEGNAHAHAEHGDASAPMTSTAVGPASPSASGPRRSRPALMIGLVVVIAALAGAFAFSRRASDTAISAAGTRPVAIFPFTARGGSVAYLRDGMVDLLAAKLDGTAEVTAIDPRSIVAATAGRTLDPAAARDLARSFGAKWFVLGGVTESADHLELDGTMYEVDGTSRVVATATVRGDSAALFRLADDLAGQLLAGVLSGRDRSLTQLAAVTTQSLPALKAYLVGEQALRDGRDAAAGAAFQDAIARDTAFALAYYRLAVMGTWTRVDGVDDPTRTAETAERHANRLTPLARQLLAAYRAYRQVDGRVIGLYRKITLAHPDNVEAWFMLGEALFHYSGAEGKSPTLSRPAFEHVLALDPANVHALLHLARLAAFEGHAQELDSLSSRLTAGHADVQRGLEVRALRAWLVHDSIAIQGVLREAARSDELVVTSLVQGTGYLLQDLDAMRALAAPFREVIGSDRMRTFARLAYTDATLAAGHWDIAQARREAGPSFNAAWLRESQALLAAEPAAGVSMARVAAIRDSIAAVRGYSVLGMVGLPPSRQSGAAMRAFLLGILSLRLGDSTAAARAEGELRTIAAARDSAARWAGELATSLRAEQRRSAGHPADALAELENFSFTFTAAGPAHIGTRERFLRAEALRAIGRDDEALQVYESFIQPVDLPFVPLSRLRQAQLHAKAGRRERAVFCYRRFLDMWRDADVELQPMVAEARRALASLEGAR